MQALVKACEARGAWAIDVNTGPLGKSAEPGMRFFIEAVQAVRVSGILAKEDIFSWGMVP